jgi:hypothetical protein
VQKLGALEEFEGDLVEHWECECLPGVSFWVGVEGVDLFGFAGYP